MDKKNGKAATTKAPMFKHAKPGSWDAAKALDFAKRSPAHRQWAILLDRLVAVDADNAETVAWLESIPDPDVVAAMSVCPVQETHKGRHYIFLRPAWADDDRYWDGARQVDGVAVDVKTRCSTGTRGVLVVARAVGAGRAPDVDRPHGARRGTESRQEDDE